MRTTAAAVGTLVFAATVPATVVGVIPRRLVQRDPGARRASPPALRVLGRVLGLAGMVGGFPLVADAFVRFVRARGTPSPVAETEELVTSGPYRLTRNPQYVGVVAMVVGEGLWWRSPRVLLYAAGLAVGFDTWVRFYEEPRLQRRFGDAYVAYRRRVPRWFGSRPAVSAATSLTGPGSWR